MRIVDSTDSTDSTDAARHVRWRGWALALPNLEIVLLVLASIVTLCAAGLAYAGQVLPLGDVAERVRRGTLINLNDVGSPDDLLPALTVFETAADRRLAAEQLHRYLAGAGTESGGQRHVDHVGALHGSRVAPAVVAGRRGLSTFRERLDTQSALPDQEARSRPLPVLTVPQILDMKPRLIVRDVGAYRGRLMLGVVLLLAGFYLAHALRRVQHARSDAVVLPALHVLCGLGFAVMVGLRDPVRDTMAFWPYAQGVFGGCVLLGMAGFVDLQRSDVRRYAFLPVAIAALLAAALLLFGSGPGTSGVRVNLLGFQPVEPIRLLIVFSFAAYFARRWEFLRAYEEAPHKKPAMLRHIQVPRFADVRPVLIVVALVLGMFFALRDLGPALVTACIFLTMYAIARRHVVLAAGGLLLVVAGFWVGYRLGFPATVGNRVAMWLAPWDSLVPGGDQLAQAFWAMASGGSWGAGPGLGDPQWIPAGHTDLVLAALGEELGFAGVFAVFLLYSLIARRGFQIAARAPSDYTCFLVIGLTLSVVVQALVIAGGLLGLVPLAGVVLPFLSYGRTAMLANFLSIGLVLSVAERMQREPRRRLEAASRRAALTLALAAVAVVARAAWIQTVASDRTAAAASLSVQADGALRYQYNPRLLAAAHQIPRGTIEDRNGVLLAGSPAEVGARRSQLDGLGAKPDACVPAADRCYPFEGAVFHLLGDAESELNWGARNTAYVERDMQARLRGFDDRPETTELGDPRTGGPVRLVRRDYRAVLPLLRYRYRPRHPEVQELLARPRDVRLTVDVRLQLRVAAALRKRIVEHGLSRGAAVVLDPATGEVLASASYPWPQRELLQNRQRGPDIATYPELLDRARYGFYPPGSTFKLVTAAAALGRDPHIATETFTCVRLPDGRVGQRLAGIRRPIRDDPLDQTPHGALNLRHALIVSCNAYFAQLGVRVGAAALRETAALFQLPVASPNTTQRLRQTLPQAAYGQGDVLASPFRMARTAAVYAEGGIWRPGHWLEDPGEQLAAGRRVMTAAAATLIAGAMREVVVAGTGRVLAANATPIAGKTGTAEVDGGASHSWFVGYAPYGKTAGRRVAFAVLLENAGYGGRAAAPVAGDIVDAARELGLLDPAAAATSEER